MELPHKVGDSPLLGPIFWTKNLITYLNFWKDFALIFHYGRKVHISIYTKFNINIPIPVHYLLLSPPTVGLFLTEIDVVRVITYAYIFFYDAFMLLK